MFKSSVGYWSQNYLICELEISLGYHCVLIHNSESCKHRPYVSYRTNHFWEVYAYVYIYTGWIGPIIWRTVMCCIMLFRTVNINRGVKNKTEGLQQLIFYGKIVQEPIATKLSCYKTTYMYKSVHLHSISKRYWVSEEPGSAVSYSIEEKASPVT